MRTVIETLYETYEKQHFQGRYASTELEIDKLNDWH